MLVTEALRDHIEAANGRLDELRAVFAWLEAEVGSEQASGLWWAVFAETDAAST